MNERDLLLRGVLNDPDDDTARLVFADWLQENGEGERAEFIRVQVEAAKYPARRLVTASSGTLARNNIAFHTNGTCGAGVGERIDLDVSKSGFGSASGRATKKLLHGVVVTRVSGCFYEGVIDADSVESPGDALRARARELLTEANSGRWAGSPLHRAHAHATHPMFWPWEFRRGFVEALTCTCADLLTHAGAIFAAHPVTSVRLSDKAPTRRHDDPESRQWIRTESATGATDEIPAEIFDLMTAENFRSCGINTIEHIGPTATERLAQWLNAACVALGRGRASLAPYPAPKVTA